MMRTLRSVGLIGLLVAGCIVQPDGQGEAFDVESSQQALTPIEVRVIGTRPCWECAEAARREAEHRAQVAQEEARRRADEEARAAEQRRIQAERDRAMRKVNACVAARTTSITACNSGVHRALADAASAEAMCRVNGGMRCSSASGRQAQLNLCSENGNAQFTNPSKNFCIAQLPRPQSPQEAAQYGLAVGRCEAAAAGDRAIIREQCETGNFGQWNVREMCTVNAELACLLDGRHRTADAKTSAAHCLEITNLAFDNCMRS